MKKSGGDFRKFKKFSSHKTFSIQGTAAIITIEPFPQKTKN
jgi:hypothetical protein